MKQSQLFLFRHETSIKFLKCFYLFIILHSNSDFIWISFPIKYGKRAESGSAKKLNEIMFFCVCGETLALLYKCFFMYNTVGRLTACWQHFHICAGNNRIKGASMEIQFTLQGEYIPTYWTFFPSCFLTYYFIVILLFWCQTYMHWHVTSHVSLYQYRSCCF